MAKVEQVTNEEEYFAMLERIKNCSIAIANPLTSDGDKARFLVAYEEMDRKLHYYSDTEWARSDPRLWRMFKWAGIDFDETPIKPNPVELPAAPVIAEPKIPNWLDE
jgi:hypothetical protein